MKSTDSPQHNYKNVIFLSLLVVLGVVLYLPVWKSLLATWSNSDDYSHGFFMVPATLYLLYLKRDKLAAITPRPSRVGLAVLLVSLASYILSYYAEIRTGASLSMLLSIVGAIYYLFGFKMLKEVMAPLLLLLFMIPIPEQIYTSITGPLQLFVSQVSTWLSINFGIPIFRQGNIMYLPDHTLEVVQACSGIRSLMSLLALSLLISYFTLHSNILRIALFLMGVPAAIIVNILRVLLMIAAFYYFDIDITEGTIHTISGVLIFILSLVIILIFSQVLASWERTES